MMGTFNFMSPEAIPWTTENTTKISNKSDVWSLGCILYNMVYGRMPFGNITNPFQKLQAIRDPQHQIPFDNCNIGVHDPLAVDVLKLCLVRDPSKRASIEELLAHRYLGTKNKSSQNKSLEQLLQDFSTFSPNTRQAFMNKATGLNGTN